MQLLRGKATYNYKCHYSRAKLISEISCHFVTLHVSYLLFVSIFLFRVKWDRVYWSIVHISGPTKSSCDGKVLETEFFYSHRLIFVRFSSDLRKLSKSLELLSIYACYYIFSRYKNNLWRLASVSFIE